MMFFLFINNGYLPIGLFQMMMQVIGHHGACRTCTKYNQIFHLYCFTLKIAV